MKTAVIALTTGGKELAEQVKAQLPDCFIDNKNIPIFEKIEDLWGQGLDAIICIMATGIVVRAIGKLCSDKTKDPCVLVLDEKGQFVISLLSGHLGGGNTLCQTLAGKIGAQAVITTASDVTGHTALDLWSKKNFLVVDDRKKLTEKSAKLINTGKVTIYTELDFDSLPEDFTVVENPEAADIIVSDYVFSGSDSLILRPCSLTVGLGCNRGTQKEDFEIALIELFSDNELHLESICSFASIDLKEDEQGMLEFAANKELKIKFYAKELLNSVDDVSSSAVVFAATGAKGVAEPAALLAAQTTFGSGTFIVRKRKWKDVTAAVAMKQIRLVA
jgi:cobalt-precorrin 5A hydrolase